MQVAIDCADPERLAVFWAEALGYRVADPPGGHATWEDFAKAEASEPREYWCKAVDPAKAGPPILFHRVPEAKAGKNRVHLDIWVAPLGGSLVENWPLVDAEADRLVELGASIVRRVAEDEKCFVVMRDPEGNEFCVCG